MQLLDLGTFVRGVTATGVLICVCACGGGGGGGGGGYGGSLTSGGSPNPVLGTTTFSTNENVALNGTLTATDPGGSALTFTQGGSPKSGTVSGLTPAGTFVYTPSANFTGSDSFPITVADVAGNSTMGTVAITVTMNHPPTASSTILRADAPSNINVLASASDPDKDKLTVTVTESALVGTASVNGDNTVSITGLPAGFKGLTRFGYTVTDPTGATATAHAVIFVGEDPFRAAFVADATGNGSYEVYLTDFAVDPAVITTATQGNFRLKGFAIADNGATVVYRTQDTTTPATIRLSFVVTKTPTQQVAIQLPGGAVPIVDGQGKDQFVVSPDGQWIAMIAGQGNTSALYVLNVTNAAVVSQIHPTSAVYATSPTFTPDSKNIYFLAAADSGGVSKSLYYAVLSSPSAATLMSAASNFANLDDVSAYSVSLDQSRIVEKARRNGGVGLFYIDPAHPKIENPLNQALVGNQTIGSSTVGLPPGLGGSTTGTKVAYDVADALIPGSGDIYVAAAATTPAPQLVATLEQVIGFSPDDSKLLYSDGAQVFEIASGPGNTGKQLGFGTQAWYDSTGNIVLLEKGPLAGPWALFYNVAPFSSPHPVTPVGSVAYDVDVSGFGRAVVLLGEAPAGGAPTAANLQLVNALVPLAPLPLTSLQSPLQLTSYISKVVSN